MDADTLPIVEPGSDDGPATGAEDASSSSLVDRMHDAEYIVIGEMDVEGFLDLDDLPPVIRDES